MDELRDKVADVLEEVLARIDPGMVDGLVAEAREYADRILAIPEIAEGMWQPIETAPLDARVMLWCGDRRASGPVFGRVAAYDDGERFVVADGMHGDWLFTDWRPLPAPPKP